MPRNTSPPPTYARPPTPKAAPKAKDNCLNIGRDDIVSPGLFTHLARPPVVGGGHYDNHRRFGGHFAVQLSDWTQTCTIDISVFRDADNNAGELITGHREHRKANTNTAYTLTADQMQALACALLDAQQAAQQTSRFERAARRACGGDNGAFVLLADREIQCLTHRGHKTMTAKVAL